MPASKAQQRATNKYIAKAYDRINLTVPKGKREMIQAHAETCNESVNGFINRAIQEVIAKDTEAAGTPTETGVVSLPSEAIKAAQEAAEAAGEGLPQFITRAISETAEREKRDRT